MTNKIHTDCGVMYRDTVICQDSVMRLNSNGYAYQVGTVAVALFDGFRPYWQIVFDLGSGWFGFPDGTEFDADVLEDWLPMIEAAEALTADPEFGKVSDDDGIQWGLDWCEAARRNLASREPWNRTEESC